MSEINEINEITENNSNTENTVHNRLTDIGYVKSVMEAHGITFRKEFGQNFLIQEAIPRRIASYVSGNVIEIGPGAGCLTWELSRRCDKVVAVEIDSGLIPVLADTLAGCPNVEVINSDIMKVGLSDLIADRFGGGDVSVCANLPYNITTPVVMKLLEHGNDASPLESIVVMVQKEVAERFASKPGDDSYGAVTAAVNYYARVERLFNVSAGNFMPRPKVDSSVIRFTPYKTPPVQVKSRGIFFRVIKGAFAQRRKTLYNSLSGEFSELPKEVVGRCIESAGLDASVRGERLGIEVFAILSDILYDYISH